MQLVPVVDPEFLKGEGGEERGLTGTKCYIHSRYSVNEHVNNC